MNATERDEQADSEAKGLSDASDDDADRMACMGADTIGGYASEMIECAACGTRVRWDLADHSFFGFAAGCPNASPKAGDSTPGSLRDADGDAGNADALK